MQNADRDKGRDRGQRRDHGPILGWHFEQWPRHLGDGGDHQSGCRGGDAGQHAAERRQVPVMCIERADRDNQNHWRAEQPGQRRQRAKRPAHAGAENHREVDHVAAGQEGAQRKGFVEFFRGEPAPPLHHYAPRPGQDAAKAGQRDRGEGQEQFGDAGRRRGGGGNVGGVLWGGGRNGRTCRGMHRSRLTYSGFPCQPGRRAPTPGLFLTTICAYIRGCRRKPAMAINGRRNKPFGPGGSTRRLHQFQESVIRGQ